MRNDEELNQLFGSVTIAAGGVLPNIHSVLLPKGKDKKGQGIQAPAPRKPIASKAAVVVPPPVVTAAAASAEARKGGRDRKAPGKFADYVL